MKIIRINAMWCPGCLISKRIWQEIEKIYPNIEYIDYDYDLDIESENYNVGDILPVVIIEKNKKEITKEKGRFFWGRVRGNEDCV